MSFSFKLNQKSLDSVEQNVKKAFYKVISSKPMLNEIGAVIVEDVVTQTKNEKSIPLKSELKLLKESWITRKIKIKHLNSPDSAYEDGKSNLTFTGQLLKSFTWVITGAGSMTLLFKGKHKPYVNLDGSTSGKEIDNSLLSKYVEAAGRPFVGVRPAIRLRVNRIVKTYIKRALVVARLNNNSVDK